LRARLSSRFRCSLGLFVRLSSARFVDR
jgi:hypothetical protein